MNVNVKVNFGPKTRAQKLQEAAEKVEKGFQSAIKVLKTQVAEDSPLAQKLQELAEKSKKGFSAIESDFDKLIKEAKMKPELEKLVEPLAAQFIAKLLVENEIEENKSGGDGGKPGLKKRGFGGRICRWILEKMPDILFDKIPVSWLRKLPRTCFGDWAKNWLEFGHCGP